MNSLQDKTVLAIDDTDAIRTFLRISLTDQGVNFHEAGSAEAGLQKCKEVDPDLIVLDLGLPDRDGLDILPELKAANENSPAVIVLTVRSERQVKETAFELGADAYVTKPFEMEELVEVLEQAVS